MGASEGGVAGEKVAGRGPGSEPCSHSYSGGRLRQRRVHCPFASLPGVESAVFGTKSLLALGVVQVGAAPLLSEAGGEGTYPCPAGAFL